ncbi:MAG: C45 family peptidase [Planctomycetota bacterium]
MTSRRPNRLLPSTALGALLLTLIAQSAPAQTAPSALQFEERTVTGGPDQFMEVKHLTLRGSQRDIGAKLAEIARDQCGGRPWHVSDQDIAAAQRDYFQAVWPQHYARMQGAAATFGAAIDDPKQNFTKIAFHVEDFFGCSVTFYPPSLTADGRGVLSRNLDFSTGTMIGKRPDAEHPAAMSRPYVIESYPDEGHASLFIGTMDLLGSAFDGINEHGLCAALLTDRELLERYPMAPRRDLTVGLSEIQLIRYLLETCATAAEAKSAILRAKHYYGFVPCHYIIADASGAAFVWEQSPDRNRNWFIENPGKPLVTTNFMLHLHDDPMALDPNEKGRGSVRRYQQLCRTIAAVDGPVDAAAIRAASAEVEAAFPAPPPHVPYAPERTLWHALYYPDDRSLEIDFYLGETPTGGGRGRPEIQRSEVFRFRLAGE